MEKQRDCDCVGRQAAVKGSSPSYYLAGGIEAIAVIEAFDLGFNLGNVIKYVLRHRAKGEALRDLEKALWYLSREVKAQRNNPLRDTTHCGNGGP